MSSPAHRILTAERVDFEIRDGFFVASTAPGPAGHDAVARTEPMRQSLPISERSDSPPMRAQVDYGLFDERHEALHVGSYVGNRTDELFAHLAKIFLIGVIQNRSIADFMFFCSDDMRMIVNLDGTRGRFRTPVEIIGFFHNFKQKTRYTNITYDRGRVFCNVDITDDGHDWTDGHIRKLVVILDISRNLINRAELRDVNDRVGPEGWEPVGIVRGTSTVV
ncbi:hypothetical protein CGCSCA5_v009743 [Colletotrichum siamense]|nr:hypothetical protein CGCSCA5_v009743 [Colletotrichum siamense]KAF4875244.1 hypothetical protein CGCSCA1_v005541 [Colletotrichum siamense]